MGVGFAALGEKNKKTAHAAKHGNQNENQARDAPPHALGHGGIGCAEANRARLERAWPSDHGQDEE